jgi:HD-GYP domain-containing protein (c-di-GMP phosphodiesterase class II)
MIRGLRTFTLGPAIATAFGVAWLRERNVRQSAERLAAATLETLMNAVDANDELTGQHVRRTAAYSLCLGEALGLSEAEQRKLERIALFHDIGKIHAALFDIVHEQTRLTPAERARIATHAQRGADVLQPLAAFYPELPAGVLAHHERWDGRGYPNGLRGEDIPIYSRVVAIADTFDAITHSRRYHDGEGFDRGATVIREGRATQFDPRVVDVFLSPDVLATIRRTFEAQPSRAAARPQRAPAADRRSRAAESSVPDVQFRWRASGSGAADGSPTATDGDTPAQS